MNQADDGIRTLMLAHIDKEDNVLYPMGESRFSKEKDEELYHTNSPLIGYNQI